MFNNRHFCLIIETSSYHSRFREEKFFKQKKYKSVNVFPNISNIFEKLMKKTKKWYLKNVLSSCLCGYRRGFTTQFPLLSLTKKLKKDFS